MWAEAYAECCAYGFQSLSIETDEEFECLVDFNKSMYTAKLYNMLLFRNSFTFANVAPPI
jgi:hypothetical protein